jgi:hypothetical protein
VIMEQEGFISLDDNKVTYALCSGALVFEGWRRGLMLSLKNRRPGFDQVTG